MKLYVYDSLIQSMMYSTHYRKTYKGFLAGQEYPNGWEFSSRKVYRTRVWPTEQVRQQWARLRRVQFQTYPAGV